MKTMVLGLIALLSIGTAPALAQTWSPNAFGYAEIRVSASNGSATGGFKQTCRFTAVNVIDEIVLFTSGHCFDSAGRGSGLDHFSIDFPRVEIMVNPDQVDVLFDGSDDAAVVYLAKGEQDLLRPHALPYAGFPGDDRNIQLVSARRNLSKDPRATDCRVIRQQPRFRAPDANGEMIVTQSDFVADCDSRRQLRSGFSGSALVSDSGFHGIFFLSVPNGARPYNAAFSVIEPGQIQTPVAVASATIN